MWSNPHLFLKCHLAPFGAVNDTGWAISDQIATSCNENTGACQLNNNCTEPNRRKVNQRMNRAVAQTFQCCKVQCSPVRIKCIALLGPASPATECRTNPSYHPHHSTPDLRLEETPSKLYYCIVYINIHLYFLTTQRSFKLIV